MNKDKLITFLTSDDEELRNIGLEIIKNNFELNFDFYHEVKYDFLFSYTLTQNNSSYFTVPAKQNIYEVLKSELAYFNMDNNSKKRIEELVNIIIEYNNEHRQNKGTSTI